MNQGYIYKLTQQANGKSYIGQTVNSLEGRYEKLVKVALSGNESKLSRAIRKYGRESFTKEIIHRVEYEDWDKLEELEREYINKFDTINNGYNYTTKTDDSIHTRLYFDEEELISKYEELLSVRKVAEFYGCDKETILDRLSKVGYKIHSKSQATALANGTRVEVYQGGGLVESFISKKDAARWFVSRGITRSRKVESVRRAIFNRDGYYGYDIRVLNK